MNRADFREIMTEIENELTEPGGTFEDIFGKKTEKELQEMRYIAAIALYAADRLYSNVTKNEFDSFRNA